MQYIKGTAKGNGEHVVIRIYDEPHEGMFDGEYIAEVVTVSDGSRKTFETYELLTEKYYLSREISENEFYFFVTLGKLATEIWLNQFTGGFPRETNCFALEKRLRHLMVDVLEEVKHGD